MGTDQIYEIAGFKVKIVWDLPDGQKFELPGFAPFLSKILSGSVDGTGIETQVGAGAFGSPSVIPFAIRSSSARVAGGNAPS